MKKTVRLSETKFRNLIKRIVEQNFEINELTFDELKNAPRMERLRDAIDKNKIIGVAFVKDDGTVRAMCFRKYLKAYVPSEAPKTEKQSTMKERLNIINVVDLNVYHKLLRETGGDRELAAKGSWRRIKLENALGFVAGDEFVDLREDNNILDRFGENVYNSLTDSMIRAIERNQQENAAAVGEEQPTEEPQDDEGVLNIQEMKIKKSIERYISKSKKK